MSQRVLQRSYFEALRLVRADARALRHHGRRGDLLILNVHSVHPESNPYAPSLHPDAFAALLRWLTLRATIVLLNDLPCERPSGARKPFVVLSFDDGLEDFAEYAMPALARYGVRANLNVIGSSMETGEPPWAIRLMDLLGSSRTADVQRLELPGFRQTLQGDHPVAKERYGAALAGHFKRLAPRDRAPAWSAVHEVLGEQVDRPTRMMSTEDVANARSAGHEIGSHSFSHESMAHLDDTAFVEDFERSKRSLQRAGCEPCLVYSFPNGSHRSGQAELLRRKGVRHVLLVGDEPSHPNAWLHPRLTLRGHSTAELRVRTTTTGMLHRRSARRAG